MAEAHSAVAFSFAITHEGVNVNFDHEVLHLVWASGVRSWKKRIARFKNNVKCGVYPAPLHSLWASIGAVSALHFSGVGVPLHLIQRIIPHLPGDTTSWQVTACSIVGMGTWLSVTFSIRYLLKMLLMYKGWMYESRGRGSKISLKTKLWLGAVKVLSAGSKPMLYSYQGSLPRLPLPSVHDTIERYLRSVRPILSDEKYKRMEKLGQEFQKGIAVKLQRYLILKSWWSTNYVSDWWEEYVYLRGRSPLMVNSNFYGIDAILMYPTKIQAARAASIIYACLIYRRLIERQELEPILIQNLVPLCSWQYERVFNTTRVPGIETDRIVHYSDSNHIVVIHKGKYYRVTIYAHRRLLTPCEIEQQMTQILNDKSEPAPGEERLASLTAGDRVAWAQARKSFFSRGINRTSLDTIERAAFIVSLDDFPYDFNENEAGCLDRYGRILLHGKGCDRWFDKSFTLCIGSNGRIGFNAEHSWGDAAVMSHLWEYIVSEEASENGADAPVLGHMWEFCLGEDMDNGYRADGHCLGESELIPPAPARLQWNMDEECLTTIAIAYQAAQSLLNDVDLRVNMYTQYGKGFMKKCRVSPDAFIQMALQLAYYRDAGRFSLTYEASMTRLYKEGRTETVRPCSIESSAWVKAMESGDAVSNEEKIKLLQKACQVHQRAYQDAMCGKGIDRHLFCLYVVSKYLEIDSPFLKEVLSEPWRLSTSQTPHGQTSRLDLRKFPKCISAGGGFGPVADDGYGVSYIIAGEDIIFFHISSKRSSPNTDSSRFSKGIERALADIRSLFEKPAVKPAAKPEVKPEVKPAVKPEVKPEVKAEVKSEVNHEVNSK